MKKGETMSQEQREKIRHSHVGKKYPNRKLSESHKENISLARKKEWKSGSRKFSTVLSPESKEKIRNSRLGKTTSIEIRRKQSLAKIGRYSGNKHPNWKGGISKISIKDRQSFEYKLWRNYVFLRDDWTCQECKKRGVNLNADHIKPFSLFPELRYEVSNGRTLCRSCHVKTPTWGGRIKNYAK
jgi:hypothetical protein